MLDPHSGERLLDVLEVQEEAEDELVSEDRLAGDDEGEGEVDSIVKLKKITRCMRI